ncbi:MAG TPA: ATP-binding cassette domain-containing protein [Roseiflexaceae bacterium]|nr:ATP-binding cassette domain-containing protein [Roseiflexaceae bacterium]
MALIDVEHLRKSFSIAIRQEGRLAALRSLVRRTYREVVAVDDVSFAVEAGEMVGYLGPNGAGKSTTMKMLTGILVPSGGRILVDGRDPHRQRTEHVRRIGVVFGQRTQLWWDLPTIESFELLRHIYQIPYERWRSNLTRFCDLLELQPFLATPVRQLSLGQRMRADLAAALLHDPAILFLDEPTIGLDVVARERIRAFLTQINREHGVTVILTTHDLGDIERLCQRVVLIDHGCVIYDGALAALRERYGRERALVVDLDPGGMHRPLDGLRQLAGVVALEQEGVRLRLVFDRHETTAAKVIAAVAEQTLVRDLTVEEPPIEGIVRAIYEAPRAGL